MPASIEEVVREVLYAHGTRHHIAGADFNASDLETAARDLATRIERYGAALHCRGGWTLAQAEVPALTAFIGDTPKEKK